MAMWCLSAYPYPYPLTLTCLSPVHLFVSNTFQRQGIRPFYNVVKSTLVK